MSEIPSYIVYNFVSGVIVKLCETITEAKQIKRENYKERAIYIRYDNNTKW